MLVINNALVTHRSARTAVDSGNDPTAWTDAPSAVNMSGSQVLRVYPSTASGTITSFSLRVITLQGSTYYTSGAVASGADVTEMIDFTGYSGESSVWVKVDALAGTDPSLTLKVSTINNE